MNKIKKVLFVGSKELGFKVLQEINKLSPLTLIGALTIDDCNDTRSMFKEIKQYCEENKIELCVAKNKTHSEDIIKKLNPDLCLGVCWYWIISEEILKSIPYGFIGIHNSFLPKYRGGSPLVHQVINGEDEVGFSFFSFTKEMDDGPIWIQEKIAIKETDYISDILKKVEIRIIENIKEKYIDILKGKIIPIEQDNLQATYCAQRFPEDGNIDWSKSSKEVYNFIRAQSKPYPGSFTYYKNVLIKIWKTEFFENEYYGDPGSIGRISQNGVYVICGDNHALIIKEIEIEDKIYKASDIIKSIKIKLNKEPI
jgi:methionyl-tRNA formyltransferase